MLRSAVWSHSRRGGIVPFFGLARGSGTTTTTTASNIVTASPTKIPALSVRYFSAATESRPIIPGVGRGKTSTGLVSVPYVCDETTVSD